jgi:hypothetical protein
MTPGPTLPSRLRGWLDDGRLFINTAALLRTVFEARRTMLILTVSPPAAVPEVLVVCVSEVVLVLLES